MEIKKIKMIKHIEKKFLFQDDYKEKLFGKNISFTPIEKQDLKNNSSSILKAQKDDLILLDTDTDKKILSFSYNNKGRHVIVPLPDFTLVYYDFAYNLNIHRKEIVTKALKELEDIDKITEVASKKMFGFYGYSTSCIINLFTCIESFINSIIPDSYIYKRTDTKRTEHYDIDQIQRFISFEDKVKKVLPDIYGKSFFQKPTKATNHIMNLKKIRDEIIHTKNDNFGKVHIKLFKDLINFDYDYALLAIRKFMNFYKNNYIKDCSCNDNY